MGHRGWPKLNVLKADYCEERGLDPSRTVVELHRPGGVWAVKQHWVITKLPGFALEEDEELKVESLRIAEESFAAQAEVVLYDGA